MERRPLDIDASALLASLTARDEGLVGTYLDLVEGGLLRLYDPAVVGRNNDAAEALIDRDPDRWARVPLFTRDFRLMAEFVDTVDDDDLARLLDAALSGRGAFRRFEAVLAGWPTDRARWEQFHTDALVRWAVGWLRSVGVEPRWDRPVPPEEDPEVPGLLRLAMLGTPGSHGDAVVRSLVTESEAEARRTFVRLARELAELWREPFQTSALRNQDRFARGAVELRRSGTTVTIRLPA